MKVRKSVLFLSAFAICVLTIPVIDKALPVVRAKESFRENFPEKALYTKLKSPPPKWMVQQINSDFYPFEKGKITVHALERTFEHISLNVTEKTPFYHYRIVDNKLYKYIPKGSAFSDTDSRFEKAFKTLLIYAKVPDVDFILCPMDGMPEPYMPPDFFLVEDFKDQAPILAQAKLDLPSAKYIALIPDQFSLHKNWQAEAQEVLNLKKEISWDRKKEIAVWRGGLTDIGIPNGHFVPNFNECPRFLLCRQSETYPLLVDAGLNWVDPEMEEVLQSNKVVRSSLTKKDHLDAKYLPVLDGHMCTYPGFQWRLLSNSVCLKQKSNQIQWFYSAIQPYVHYIPVENDMSDLIEKIEWAKSHDEETAGIAKNGGEFAKNNLLIEDNYLYLYLVLNKLSSLEKIDSDNFRSATEKDPQWKCIQYRKQLSLIKSYQKIKRYFFRN